MNPDRIIKFTRIALLSLKENKKQAILTMLGIIIGIAAVIMVLSVGKGAEKLILASIESFGNRSIFIQPGGGSQGGPPNPTAIDKIKYKDYLALLNLDYIEDITPMLIRQGTTAYQSEILKNMIIGTNQNYGKALNISIKFGRDLEATDIASGAKVTVIGQTTAKDLFGDLNPVGETININNLNFQVIGVYGKQGQRFFQDFDKRVIIPITTMKNTITGVDYVNTIFGNVREGYPINEAIQDLRFLIRQRHALVNPENDPNKDDFRVVSQVDGAKTFQGISDAISYFLVMIAAISLLVGGIGIMNIMFVSVSERTREIGLRKAVGASNADIMLQFLIESMVITLIAGIAGVVIGIFLSFLISLVVQQFSSQWQFIVTPGSTILSFTVSVLIGLIFGLYPAYKASILNPIEALRQE